MMVLVDYPDHSVPVPQNQEGENYISQTPLQVGLGSTKPDMVKVKWSQQMKRENLLREKCIGLVLWGSTVSPCHLKNHVTGHFSELRSSLLCSA